MSVRKDVSSSASQQDPLLATKLYIPPARPGLVSRPRLTQRLNEGMTRKLTLISAPAGFGKTTLLSEWIQQNAECGMRNDESAESTVHHSSLRQAQERLFIVHPSRVAWVSLDEGDNDPARFLAYFVAALQTLALSQVEGIEANIGAGTLGALQSPQPPPIESVLTALINEIAAVPDPFVLVLDDYHVIEAQPIHDALTFLLNHLPPQMHLVIASRADPSLPLARLRGRGQLTELRAADLRFTPDEAAAFLNQVMGLGLSAEEVTALETRTEGWIVGLQLAALSMQGRKDTASFIQAFTGSHHFVLDYLAEEVLQRQPEPVQTFLLQTAVLDRLTGPLCDAVTGTPSLMGEGQGEGSGQAILEALERANLFIAPLDDERRWYRYHHLFADLLRARLKRAQPNRVPALHRRASEWYERNGLTAEAVGHALAAEDFEGAARLVEQNARPTSLRGELTTLLGWLESLPDELVRTRPWLCIFHAWALLLTGQLNGVEPRLQDAVGAVGEPPLPDDVQGEVTAIRAYVAALRGDAPRTIELARQALEWLPEDNLIVRSVVAFTLGGACILSDDVAEAGQAFAEASAISQAAGNIHLAVPALGALAWLQVVQGQLHQAAETYREALQLATPSLTLPPQGEVRGGGGGRPLPVAAGVYSGMGELLYEWNDLEAAVRHVMESLEQSQQWGHIDALTSSYVALARVRQAQGDLDGAFDMLEQADQIVRGHTLTPTTDARLAANRMQLWVAKGNLANAARCAQERGLTAEDELSYLREVEYIVLGRILIARGKLDEAVGLLARLLQAAEVGGRMGHVIEILALQALALQAQSDTARAMTALERALSLAEPEGYVRIFVDEGPPMAKLLRQVASRGIALDYVSKLLAAFGAEEQRRRGAEESAPLPPSSPAPMLVEPLSERELEVLRLVAAGLSNREIAQELVVAVSTVKSHINHIYGKLGVKSRTQAIARAKALGLL